MKVRSVPISNVLLAEIKDWFAFREEMAKKKSHVEESPYVFYSQRSPKFTQYCSIIKKKENMIIFRKEERGNTLLNYVISY